ncbi:MAG: mercury transporter MerC [Betaproteobacteria bacterium HGW-Betaproteobacteria-11]|nr:MAG: mercury transporter MerC [Betaproteobacteria bacterium HGW-Betaproteobacteria-11]
MKWTDFTRFTNKTGTLTGAAGAVIGLGFLDQYEDAAFETLFPLFAGIAIAAQIFGWFNHRQWWRTLLGLLGPVLLLLSLYVLFANYAWSTYVTYAGLALMVLVSLWDIFSPAVRRCEGADSAGGSVAIATDQVNPK